MLFGLGSLFWRWAGGCGRLTESVCCADFPPIFCLGGGGPNSLRSNKGRLHPPILQNPRRLKHPATAARPAPEKARQL